MHKDITYAKEIFTKMDSTKSERQLLRRIQEMKFIRMTVHTEEFKKSPPANLPDLLDAHTRWLEEQKESGKLLDAYLLAGNAQGDRSITIWELESPEEIDKCIWDDPMGFTFIWEVYPAVSVFGHINNVMQNWSKIGETFLQND